MDSGFVLGGLPADLVPSIFHEPWWLDRASRGQYKEAQVWTGGRLVGRLPYATSRHYGMELAGMPMLTHFLGPALEEPSGGQAAGFLRQVSVTKDLVRQLPHSANVYIKHHHAVADTLAFQTLGFQTDVQFTSEIAPAPREALWRQMRDKTRNVIRRAAERLGVIELTDPDRFMAFYDRNLTERNLRNYYDAGICGEIMRECLRRGVGRILVAQDAARGPQAGIFTVWDRRAEYYLMSTRATGSINGAVSLLLWTAIQDSARRNIVFDFDGVGNPNDVLFFSGFGGKMKPRYITYRYSTMFVALNATRRLAKFYHGRQRLDAVGDLSPAA